MASDIQAMEAETQKEINEMLAQLEKDEATNVAAVGEDFKGEASDSLLDDVVGSLKVDDTEIAGEPKVAPAAQAPVSVATVAPVAVASAPVLAKVTEFPKPIETSANASTSHEGSLTLKLSGKMSLKLQYETEGNVVSVSFEDDAFIVQLDGGAEFRLPIGKNKSKSQKTA